MSAVIGIRAVSLLSCKSLPIKGSNIHVPFGLSTVAQLAILSSAGVMFGFVVLLRILCVTLHFGFSRTASSPPGAGEGYKRTKEACHRGFSTPARSRTQHLAQDQAQVNAPTWISCRFRMFSCLRRCVRLIPPVS